MADASYVQTSFLGGEISQYAQGQFDKPYYKTALSEAFNLWPSDEGPISRRPGFRSLGVTDAGKPGRLLAFDFSQATPYNLELTDNKIRMWNNTNLVTTNDNQFVQSISSDAAAVFTLNGTVSWATGDTAYFTFDTAQEAFAGNALLNRQFKITMLNSTQFTVADSVTGHVIGTSDNVAGLIPVVNHALEIVSPYTAAGSDWHTVRRVQGYNLAVLLHSGVAPQSLQVINPPTTGTFATFSFSPAGFIDGPYLDPTPNTVAYPNSSAASLQLTMGYPLFQVANTIYGLGVRVTFNGNDYISLINGNAGNFPDKTPSAWQPLSAGSMVNAGQGFASTDKGRMIRLFYEPPVWSPTITYSSGQNVTYNGSYFTALVGSNTNNAPDISLNDWVLNTAIAYWTWGFITSVNAPNSVTAQLQGAVLLDTTPIVTWRLGAWSDTTGWPTCGCYQEGRFWYAGAIPNRVDSSQPNQPFNMAPTGQDGTVADSNAISYTFNASENNPIFWGIGDHSGILWGTQEGEFLMTSGSSGTPMTPSNIQAHLETRYGSSNIQPVRTGLTVCFVKRYARRVLEYLADVFSGRFFASDLTQNARHLGARTLEELDYQEELIPTLWGRCADGSLIGATYRRKSLFSSEGPEFNAWHKHRLGSDRFIESISVGPSVEGTLDALSIVSNDQATGIRFVEQMTTLLDETASVTQSWFLDTAITPGAGSADVNSLFAVSSWGKNSLDALTEICGSFCGGQNAMKVINASGPASNPTAVWIGGFINPGSSCVFQVEKLDVTGDTPVIAATYNSSTFSMSSPTDTSWSLDPTGRYIAMYMADSTTAFEMVIFDTQTLSFGTVLSYTASSSRTFGRQIAWVDNSNLVITSRLSTTVGVELFSVSGTTISHTNFTSIWGAGSTSTRTPMGYAQFLPNPNGDGLIHLMADIFVDGINSIYAVPLFMASGSLRIGSGYTVVTGLNIASFAADVQWNILQTNPNTKEYTLCLATAVYTYFISFVPTFLTAAVTRRWQKVITSITANTLLATFPIYYQETNLLLLVQIDSLGQYYAISTISLTATSFVLLSDSAPVSNISPLVQSFYCARLDSQRLIFLGIGPGSVTPADIGQVGIISDPPGVPSLINFYGLNNFNGKKVSVYAAAIDCGEYVVDDGKVSVPLGIADPTTGWVFNEQSFKALQPISNVFSDISVPILYASTTYNIPCVIGFNYESRGQLCRPQLQQDTGAKNGPGFGKKRRTSKYALQLVNTLGIKVGTNFNKMRPAPLTKIDAGGKTLNYLNSFTGIIRETLDDDFSYDSMLTFKIDRPTPGTVTVFGGFIETSDV